MARGMEEVAASSLEDQFAGLEDTERDLEIEARLAEMKGGSSSGSLGAGSGAGASDQLGSGPSSEAAASSGGSDQWSSSETDSEKQG